MQLAARCMVCSHDQREDIHDGYYNHGMTYADLARKFFPDKEPKQLARSFRNHFGYHFNADADVAAITVNHHLPAIRNSVDDTPMTVSQERVYDAVLKNRISSAATIEKAMANLMEKINHLEEEWDATVKIDECSTCGRSDDGPVLAKMLKTFEELRKMHESLLKVRNPLDVFKKFFSSTFEIYTDKVMEIYMAKLREKGRAIGGAVNQFLRGDVSPAVLARRMTELEDLGADELEREVKDQFRRILASARKEMDVAL